MTDPLANPINYLQEFCQKQGSAFPVYTELSATGPHHCPTFSISCSVLGHESVGSGTDKKRAKKEAAAKIIQLLNKQGMITNLNETNIPTPTDVKNPITALMELAVKEKVESPAFFHVNPGSNNCFIVECTFKNDKTYGEGTTKKSAKTLSAAMMCQKCNIPFMPLEKSKPECKEASSVVGKHSGVQELQEYITKHNLRQPVYEEKNLINNMFEATCNVGPFSGKGIDLTKEEAKSAAAFEVLNKLTGSCTIKMESVDNGPTLGIFESENGVKLEEFDFEEDDSTPDPKLRDDGMPKLENLTLDDSGIDVKPSFTSDTVSQPESMTLDDSVVEIEPRSTN